MKTMYVDMLYICAAAVYIHEHKHIYAYVLYCITKNVYLLFWRIFMTEKPCMSQYKKATKRKIA